MNDAAACLPARLSFAASAQAPAIEPLPTRIAAAVARDRFECPDIAGAQIIPEQFDKAIDVEALQP